MLKTPKVQSLNLSPVNTTLLRHEFHKNTSYPSVSCDFFVQLIITNGVETFFFMISCLYFTTFLFHKIKRTCLQLNHWRVHNLTAYARSPCWGFYTFDGMFRRVWEDQPGVFRRSSSHSWEQCLKYTFRESQEMPLNTESVFNTLNWGSVMSQSSHVVLGVGHWLRWSCCCGLVGRQHLALRAANISWRSQAPRWWCPCLHKSVTGRLLPCHLFPTCILHSLFENVPLKQTHTRNLKNVSYTC